MRAVLRTLCGAERIISLPDDEDIFYVDIPIMKPPDHKSYTTGRCPGSGLRNRRFEFFIDEFQYVREMKEGLWTRVFIEKWDFDEKGEDS